MNYIHKQIPKDFRTPLVLVLPRLSCVRFLFVLSLVLSPLCQGDNHSNLQAAGFLFVDFKDPMSLLEQPSGNKTTVKSAQITFAASR